MNRMECPREQEVVSASRVVGWQDTCSDELKKHVSDCETCRDLVSVIGILREDHALAGRDMQLPLAGQVWWRAAVRARAEASNAAVRPLTWVHGIAAACVIGLIAGSIHYAWRFVPDARDWVSSIALRIAPAAPMVADLVDAAQARLPLIVVVTASLILMPVALYFALRDEES
jgi:hypothetical protein